MAEHLVLCGDVKRAGRQSPLTLALSGRSQNISLKIEDISKKLVRNIPDILIDLVEIATYVFCADQAISRGDEAQRGMGAHWRRDLCFVIPVRNPSHWKRREVSGALCSALSFLSEDNYAFEFKKATQPAAFQDYLEFAGGGAEFKADDIVLFSGGLDSLGGAIEELSKSGTRIALVSHRSSPKIFEHQKRLVGELKHRFPGRVMYIPVLATRQAPLKVREHTQRTRSFLYAALACVVAGLFGNNRIRFFENGVVSINLPISEQVVGARATRTTHPLVLDHFEKVFSRVLDKPATIENSSIWKTKPDVVRSIVDSGCGELIKDTISCTRTYDITKLHTHCGCCSQCLDRRFAILAAGASKYDPADMYKVDLLIGPRDRPNDQTMAESCVRTALELREMSEQGFFSRFGGESARVCAGFPSVKPDDTARQVFDLHRRHGEELRRVLKAAIEGHSEELVTEPCR